MTNCIRCARPIPGHNIAYACTCGEYCLGCFREVVEKELDL
jgi:hypothetical protein